MFCPKCGNEVKAETGICSNCGFDINSVNHEGEQKNIEEQVQEKTEQSVIAQKPKKQESNSYKELSIASFVLSGIFLILGFYKMLIYENGESYPYDMKNAYVGGDAYNFIINGTYTTAYFVLMAAFLIFGVGLLIYGELVLQRKLGNYQVDGKTSEEKSI